MHTHDLGSMASCIMYELREREPKAHTLAPRSKSLVFLSEVNIVVMSPPWVCLKRTSDLYRIYYDAERSLFPHVPCW